MGAPQTLTCAPAVPGALCGRTAPTPASHTSGPVLARAPAAGPATVLPAEINAWHQEAP